MFQNPLNQSNRKNGEHGTKHAEVDWKPWATVNLNLSDAEGAVDILREGNRLFGAENVMVETETDTRWKILVRTRDPNYMHR